MSVRVVDRSLSKMEYVHNAQKIVNLIEERIDKYVKKIAKDKRYKHFVKSSQYSIWNSPIYHAQKIYQYCQLADMKREPNLRLIYIEYANQNLQLLESSLETFYIHFNKVINDKFIELVTKQIDYEYELLKGLKYSCRNNSCKS